MAAPLSAAQIEASLQCELRLWKRLDGREPPSDPVASAELDRLRAGLRALYPEAPDAPASGSALPLPEAGTPAAVLGAQLSVAGVSVRLDLLERREDGRLVLGLVDSETRVRDPLVDRAALQFYLLEYAGFEVGSVEALLPDPKYVRDEELDWQSLFRRIDITRQARLIAGDVPGDLARAAAVAAAESPPAVEPSPHCRRPSPCEFWTECTAARKDDWIGHLPRLRPPRYQALRELGVESIAQLDEAELQVASQRNARRALLAGATFARDDLGRRLAGFGPPAHFLDFEAVSPAVPVFEATRPFEVVPFLWSAHSLDRRGELRHRDWIGPEDRDPRPGLARTLLDALGGDDAPIVVYSGFEAETIEGLATALPDLAGELRRLAGRLRDLLALVRETVYAPGFRGSFSLKRVAPALVAGFDYAGLEVADGGTAASSFLELARAEKRPEGAPELCAALRAYCACDTLALVELLGALRRLADSGASRPGPP